jgi:two-component system, OmpR family, sensor histidine kinase TorS
VTSSSNYLYVEDDALSREIMQLLLCEVVGVESLVMFEDSTNFTTRVKALVPTPDFILLDIHIEPFDGHQILSMLRTDPAFVGCKIIAVTASVMIEEVKQLRASGFDGALAKPLDMETFPALIKRLQNGEAVWQIA